MPSSSLHAPSNFPPGCIVLGQLQNFIPSFSFLTLFLRDVHFCAQQFYIAFLITREPQFYFLFFFFPPAFPFIFQSIITAKVEYWIGIRLHGRPDLSAGRYFLQNGDVSRSALSHHVVEIKKRSGNLGPAIGGLILILFLINLHFMCCHVMSSVVAFHRLYAPPRRHSSCSMSALSPNKIPLNILFLSQQLIVTSTVYPGTPEARGCLYSAI
jgi:hypothetical protein